MKYFKQSHDFENEQTRDLLNLELLFHYLYHSINL